MSAKLKEELRNLFQETFDGIIDGLVEQVVFAMKQHIQDTFNEESVKPPVRNALRSLPRAPRAEGSTRNSPRHCLAPECEKPHGGPRLSYMCPEHVHTYTKAQKQNLNAAWKADQAAFHNRPLPSYADDQQPPA